MPLLREVLLSGQAALASGLLYSALACDARDGAPPVLAAAKVAGCYEFADSAGRPIHQAAFWSAPVRLDTTAALLDSDGGYRKEPGVYAVIPTATIPPEHAIDTALLRSTWQVLPPDTVLVMRSDGYIGHAIRVHADGGVLRGTQEWFNDVIDTTRLPVRHPVSARRVTCNNLRRQEHDLRPNDMSKPSGERLRKESRSGARRRRGWRRFPTRTTGSPPA